MKARTRVLLLSAQDPHGRPDTDVGDVTAGIAAALAAQAGVDVTHAEVSTTAEVERAVRSSRPIAVFNFCEALAGESSREPLVPMVLERLGVAFTGSPTAALRTCLDKWESSEQLRRAGVRVPRTLRFASAEEVPADVPLPAIVKPSREDGSVGIDAGAVVRDFAALRERVAYVLATVGGPVVAQEYVEGRELAISLLGDPEPRVLPLGEIAFDRELLAAVGVPQILTYASKWVPDTVEYAATKSVTAATPPQLAMRLAATGRRAFDALGLRDYGRVDVRVDARGEPWVIDVNPNCDLSRDGGFAKAAKRAGLDYEALIGIILRGALARAAEMAQPASLRRPG